MGVFVNQDDNVLSGDKWPVKVLVDGMPRTVRSFWCQRGFWWVGGPLNDMANICRCSFLLPCPYSEARRIGLAELLSFLVLDDR